LVSEIVHDTTTYSRMKEQDGETLKMEDLRESLGKYGIQKLKVGGAEGEGGEEEGGKGPGAGGEAAGGGGGGAIRRSTARNL